MFYLKLHKFSLTFSYFSHFWITGTPACRCHIHPLVNVIHACFHTQRDSDTTQDFFLLCAPAFAGLSPLLAHRLSGPLGPNPPLLQMASEPLLPKPPRYIIIASWFSQGNSEVRMPKSGHGGACEVWRNSNVRAEEAVLLTVAPRAVRVYIQVEKPTVTVL